MRLSYPLTAEDMMKLLDKAFDRAIELSKPIKDLANNVKTLAEHVEKIAMNLAVIAHNQAVHHHMIQQINGAQQALFKKLTEHSLDTSLPKIELAKPVLDTELKLDEPPTEKKAPVKKATYKDKPN